MTDLILAILHHLLVFGLVAMLMAEATLVRPGMRAREALRLLQANCFHVLRVVGRDNRMLGEVDEGQLVLAIAKKGLTVTVGEILSFDRA